MKSSWATDGVWTASPLGPQPLTCISGTHLYALGADELIVLTGYALIAQQGAGELYLKMDQGRVVAWSIKPDVGNAGTLNAALGVRRT